jgi:hypothetical protein
MQSHLTIARTIIAAVALTASVTLVATDANAGPRRGNVSGNVVSLNQQRVNMRGAGELTMIQLQNTVSQRQQVLQLTTNMMNSTNRSSKNMIKNCPNCFR